MAQRQLKTPTYVAGQPIEYRFAHSKWFRGHVVESWYEGSGNAPMVETDEPSAPKGFVDRGALIVRAVPFCLHGGKFYGLYLDAVQAAAVAFMRAQLPRVAKAMRLEIHNLDRLPITVEYVENMDPFGHMWHIIVSPEPGMQYSTTRGSSMPGYPCLADLGTMLEQFSVWDTGEYSDYVIVNVVRLSVGDGDDAGAVFWQDGKVHIWLRYFAE